MSNPSSWMWPVARSCGDSGTSRPMSALLTIQEEIVKEIANTLHLTRNGEDERRIARHYPENTEAYQLYLRGRYDFDQRTADGTRRSIDSFREAIKKDPDYALAYAGLANAYVPSDTVLPPAANCVLAQSASDKALASDNSLAQVQTAVARVLLFCKWDWPGAERAFQRAIQLNPRYTEAHHMYSHYLVPMGRSEESVREALLALELDPLDVLLNVHLGWAYLHSRRFDEAITQSLKAVAMDPNLEVARTGLGRAYLGKKMYEQALSEFEKVVTLAGGVATGPDTYLGYTFAVMGRTADALVKLEVLQERYRQRTASAYDVALLYAGLNDRDRAMEWLEKAIMERSGGVLQVRADPMFESDPLRSWIREPRPPIGSPADVTGHRKPGGWRRGRRRVHKRRSGCPMESVRGGAREILVRMLVIVRDLGGSDCHSRYNPRRRGSRSRQSPWPV